MDRDKKLTIQNPKTFLDAFVAACRNANQEDMIWVQSLLFEPGKYVKTFTDALFAAKANGASLYVLFDSYGILTTQEVPIHSIFPSSKITDEIIKIEKEKKSTLAVFREKGIAFRVRGNTGVIKATLPFLSCNHRKSYGIINEKTQKHTAWVTGVNIAQDAFDYFDIAVEVQEKFLVEALYSQFLNDYTNREQQNNKIIKINENTTYIIENNTFNSAVLKQAAAIISQAEKYVRFTSQYAVDPFLLNTFIKKTKPGVQIEVLLSEEHDVHFNLEPFRYFHSNLKRVIAKNPNITLKYFPGKVHAKILFSEKEALVGSDNLTVVLKILHTKENMLAIKNNFDFITELELFFENGWKRGSK